MLLTSCCQLLYFPIFVNSSSPSCQLLCNLVNSTPLLQTAKRLPNLFSTHLPLYYQLQKNRPAVLSFKEPKKTGARSARACCAAKKSLVSYTVSFLKQPMRSLLWQTIYSPHSNIRFPLIPLSSPPLPPVSSSFPPLSLSLILMWPFPPYFTFVTWNGAIPWCEKLCHTLSHSCPSYPPLCSTYIHTSGAISNVTNVYVLLDRLVRVSAVVHYSVWK